MKRELTIHGLDLNIAYAEAKGLSLCFKAYADECSREDIMMIGFNANTGYVYIALENGIQICSCLGQDIEYLVTNMDDGEEHFFDEYQDAEQKISELN